MPIPEVTSEGLVPENVGIVAAPVERFVVNLDKLKDGRWMLSIKNDEGALIFPSTHLAFEEVFRMMRLKVVTLAYPVPYQEPLLRNA
jgi:hypothetical protein